MDLNAELRKEPLMSRILPSQGLTTIPLVCLTFFHKATSQQIFIEQLSVPIPCQEYIEMILCSLFLICALLGSASRFRLQQTLGLFGCASYSGFFCLFVFYHHLSSLRCCEHRRPLSLLPLPMRKRGVKQTALRLWMQERLLESYKWTIPLLAITKSTTQALRWTSWFPSSTDLFLWMVIPSSTALFTHGFIK